MSDLIRSIIVVAAVVAMVTIFIYGIDKEAARTISSDVPQAETSKGFSSFGPGMKQVAAPIFNRGSAEY